MVMRAFSVSSLLGNFDIFKLVMHRLALTEALFCSNKLCPLMSLQAYVQIKTIQFNYWSFAANFPLISL